MESVQKKKKNQQQYRGGLTAHFVHDSCHTCGTDGGSECGRSGGLIRSLTKSDFLTFGDCERHDFACALDQVGCVILVHVAFSGARRL